MRKKTVVIVELIKTLYHCSLPQTSRFDSRGPAQADVSKSIANLGCWCPACSSLHGPALFTSFGLPHPLFLPYSLSPPPLVPGQYFIQIPHHTVQPAPTQCYQEIVTPEYGANQPALLNQTLLSRCPNHTNAQGPFCFRKLRCSQNIKARNVKYLCCFVLHIN